VKLAAVHAIEGADKIAHFLGRVFRKYGKQSPVRIGQINGMPGVITMDAEGTLQSVTLEIRDGLIVAIYIVRNPNKLAHIGETEPA
jgi:hypothetical protein